MQRFCRRIGIRLYRPSSRLLRGDLEKQAEAEVELADLRKKAEAGELVLRPAVVDVVTAAVHSKHHVGKLGPSQAEDGQEQNEADAGGVRSLLRHVGRLYPEEKRRRVVLIIDNAPWHRGQVIDEASTANPHLGFKRRPSDSRRLDVIEHSWKRRRRATHNRFFEGLSDPRRSIRASLCYTLTARRRIRSVVAKSYLAHDNRTASAGL